MDAATRRSALYPVLSTTWTRPPQFFTSCSDSVQQYDATVGTVGCAVRAVAMHVASEEA
jgi:hypothetical protein